MKLAIGQWNVWRITRLVLGIIFMTAGFFEADYILAAAGIFLIVHAWVNSCAACQTETCETNQSSNYGKL